MLTRVTTLVVCLAAGIPAAAEPDPPRVHAVRITGDPVFTPETLAREIVRLRSFYLAQGYVDAEVEVADVTTGDRGASVVTLHVRAGPRPRVRQLRFEGLPHDQGPSAETTGVFPADAVCACLLGARQQAEADGRLDFAAEIEVTPIDPDRLVVDVVARVRMGTPHRVGRIEFTGHRRVNESTLRRALALPEGERFDVGALRRGLSRLNATDLFEPLTLADVEIASRADGVGADLRIPLRERPRYGWRLSGIPLPLRPESVQLTLASRLPGWGRGIVEASTYVLTWNLFGLAGHVLGVPWLSRLSSVLVLERPWLPGQAPFSGFAVSPGLSARSMLSHYVGTQVAHGVRMRLAIDPSDAMGVIVVDGSRAPADEPESHARVLLCEPAKPRLWWLRRGTAQAVHVALAWLPR